MRSLTLLLLFQSIAHADGSAGLVSTQYCDWLQDETVLYSAQIRANIMGLEGLTFIGPAGVPIDANLYRTYWGSNVPPGFVRAVNLDAWEFGANRDYHVNCQGITINLCGTDFAAGRITNPNELEIGHVFPQDDFRTVYLGCVFWEMPILGFESEGGALFGLVSQFRTVAGTADYYPCSGTNCIPYNYTHPDSPMNTSSLVAYLEALDTASITYPQITTPWGLGTFSCDVAPRPGKGGSMDSTAGVLLIIGLPLLLLAWKRRSVRLLIAVLLVVCGTALAESPAADLWKRYLPPQPPLPAERPVASVPSPFQCKARSLGGSKVEWTLTNVSTKDVLFLPWNTPWDQGGFRNEILTVIVKDGGKESKVPYNGPYTLRRLGVGKYTPTYVELAPKKSVTAVLDLRFIQMQNRSLPTYDIRPGTTYQVAWGGLIQDVITSSATDRLTLHPTTVACPITTITGTQLIVQDRQ